MKKKIFGILSCTLLILASTSFIAAADWEPGDDHKMHFPQLPDPFGWDVSATGYPTSIVLADDWMCSESGPVKDIHFWGSWKNDVVGIILSIVVAIHANIPADPPEIPYSRPGEKLWERTFSLGDWIVAGPFEGLQGWYDPAWNLSYPNDHLQYFQYNIENISDPFIQEKGTIYWLSISVNAYEGMWGWKSSEIHWNDNAVWKYQGDVNWTEMYEPPDFDEPLDLAFVITGEVVNHPPNTPTTPSGPTSGEEGVWYTYTTSTTDPDCDDVRYGWDVNCDDIVDYWTRFYPSGATCTVKIKFMAAGTYYLKVKAEDVHGAQSDFSPALKVVIRGANNPPDKPSTPSGPSTGNPGVSYTYSTSGTDPDGDNIKYGWDWDGDDVVDEWTGFYSSGETVSMSHSWSTAGTYYLKVKTEDVHGAQSVFSDAKEIVINTPPEKPARPSGPTSGKVGVSYSYSSSTTDADGDQIYYLFDWGDGTTSGWKGPYASGQIVSESHIWTARGNYQVKVKAKDTYGWESIWSDPLSINMPKSKAINSFFYRFLENHPRLFPIIRHLLSI
jgi:hypothetical protein